MLLILLGYFLLKLSFLVARVVFIFKAVVRWQIMLKLDSLPSQGKKGNGLATTPASMPLPQHLQQLQRLSIP
jgi:hypothetical protein